MNKAEIVAKVAENTQMSKAKVDEVIDSFLSSITDALVSGDTVVLRGFGTFEVRVKEPREITHPVTREKYYTARSKTVALKNAKALKETLSDTEK